MLCCAVLWNKWIICHDKVYINNKWHNLKGLDLNVFNRELVSADLRVDLLLGICQQVFLFHICFKSSQRYSKVVPLVIKDIIYTIDIRDITSNSNKSSNGNLYPMAAKNTNRTKSTYCTKCNPRGFGFICNMGLFHLKCMVLPQKNRKEKKSNSWLPFWIRQLCWLKPNFP